MPSLSRRYALNLTLLMSGSAAALLWPGPALAGCATDSSSVLPFRARAARRPERPIRPQAPTPRRLKPTAPARASRSTTRRRSRRPASFRPASWRATRQQRPGGLGDGERRDQCHDDRSIHHVRSARGDRRVDLGDIRRTFLAGPAIGLNSGTGQSAVFDGFDDQRRLRQSRRRQSGERHGLDRRLRP